MASRVHEEEEDRVTSAQAKHAEQLVQLQQAAATLKIEPQSSRQQLEQIQRAMADEKIAHGKTSERLNQGDLHQAQEEVRGLRQLKDEQGFAQRRIEELSRRLVELDAAVLQLSTSNEQLQTRADELLAAKQQLELALATARSSVTAQEQVVASMLERLTALAGKPDLAAAKDVKADGSEVGKSSP